MIEEIQEGPLMEVLLTEEEEIRTLLVLRIDIRATMIVDRIGGLTMIIPMVPLVVLMEDPLPMVVEIHTEDPLVVTVVIAWEILVITFLSKDGMINYQNSRKTFTTNTQPCNK
jgi:hypothetical protein